MSILFPPDLSSRLILSFLFATVLYWGWRLARAWIQVKREEMAIDHLSQPEVVAAMKEYRRKQGPSGSAEGLIDHLSEHTSVSPSRVAAEHVTSILDAGLTGARLETEQRLSNAGEEIFRENSRLKAILSIFIVIGLLGTLYGLAVALGTLTAGNLANFEPSVVDRLLRRLKTALAPSIWGVFLTVIGVLTYSYYINAVCRPIKSKLEHSTLEKWVPALYPTESQQAKETLEEAQQQLQENVESAQRVARFAERVDEDLQDFDERIRSAGALLERVEGSLEGLAETSDNFQEAMSNVEDFQEQLTGTFEQIESRQESLASLLEGLRERDDSFRERLSEIEELHQAWQNHLSETQDRLQEVTEATQNALAGLEGQSEELIEEVTEPVAEKLEGVSVRLSELDESTHRGLQNVESSLNRLQNPLEGSAERIERIAETFSDNLQSSVSGVREEFHRQNDVRSNRTDELARLNENLESLIEKQEAVHDAIRQSDLSENGTGILRRVQDYFRS